MKVNLYTPLEEVQVPIIPLIDVVFCILTFFLLAALQFTRQQAINLDLPQANTGTTTNSISKKLFVRIDPQGNTSIENTLVRREDLEEKLRQYIQANPDATLLLDASRTATYNDFVQTLDLMRKVGGSRVSLAIQPIPSQTSTNQPSLPNNSNTAPTTPNTVPIPGGDFQGNPNPYPESGTNQPGNINPYPQPGTNQPGNINPYSPPGTNQPGNINPYSPPGTNQLPLNGQGINPSNSGVAPGISSQQQPQLAPGNQNSNPRRNR